MGALGETGAKFQPGIWDIQQELVRGWSCGLTEVNPNFPKVAEVAMGLPLPAPRMAMENLSVFREQG